MMYRGRYFGRSADDAEYDSIADTVRILEERGCIETMRIGERMQAQANQHAARMKLYDLINNAKSHHQRA